MDDIIDPSAAGEPHRSHRPGREAASSVPADSSSALSISCDDCSMRSTAACDECVVTFLLDGDDDSLVLDLDQARVVRLLGNAGLVPDLKFRVAG